MFKAMAADLAGTSDNCTPVPREKWSDPATVNDSLEFLRPGEQVHVYLKSKIYEWIFTDLGLLRIERENAAGIKRYISRLPWVTNDIQLQSLRFATAGAGMTDYACDIDSVIGGQRVHIEIVKSETPFARKLFLALTEIAVEQLRNKQILSQAQSLKTQILVGSADPAALSNLLSVASRDLILTWDPISYGHVFEKVMA